MKAPVPNVHLTISPDLHAEINAALPLLRVQRRKREPTTEPAYATEFLRLAARVLLRIIAEGGDPFARTNDFHGWWLADKDGAAVAWAPLASTKVYERIERSGRKPSAISQTTALEADARLLRDWMRVRVRGCAFGTPPHLAGKAGDLRIKAGRYEFILDGSTFGWEAVHPFDVVPENGADS